MVSFQGWYQAICMSVLNKTKEKIKFTTLTHWMPLFLILERRMNKTG